MKNHLTRKVGFDGTPKVGPYWKSQPIARVEIRIECVNKDTSHSRVCISHGLNKLVTDLIDKECDDNEQETSEMQFEDFALKTNVLAFCEPIKGWSKTTKTYLPASSSAELVPIGETKKMDWYWARRLYVPVAYPVSKQLSTLLRNGSSTSRRRWSDWILQTERWYSESNLSTLNVGPMMYGRAGWQEGLQQEKFNIVLIHQDKKFFISELSKVIQDAISLILHYRTMY